MIMTRRDMLGFASAAGAIAATEPLLAAAPAARPALTKASAAEPAPAEPALAEVVDRLRAFARADLADKGFPAMSVALFGPRGVEASFAIGFADLDRRIAATPDHLFQIGSITKSLTALALFVLADRGRLDLDANVQELLPEAPLPPEPISLTHLLDHSSGLPNSLDEPAVLRLPGGRLWTGFAPGARYSYCNLGYALLGAVLARAAAMPWPVALDRLVLKPLGMARAVPVIRTADRAAYANGHVRFRDDIPWLPGARLAQARWFDFAHAAGSVAATGPDMLRYLRYLAELARGRGAPLFSDALARRFATPTIDSAPPGARYGNGLHSLPIDGRPCFRHTGGVLGFSSAVTLDREAGVGCYASVNVGGAGGYRPVEITEYALPLLRALAIAGPLPAPRSPKPAPAVAGAAGVAGRWRSADGGDLAIAERGGALFVASGGRERPLRAGPDGGFVTDHPALAPYSFVVDGPLLRLGGRVFGRDTAPPALPAAPRLAALVGTYYNPSAWGTRPRVFAFGDRLFLNTTELVEAPDGSWRSTSPGLASERIWFQQLVDGRAQLLNISGTAYGRLEDLAP